MAAVLASEPTGGPYESRPADGPDHPSVPCFGRADTRAENGVNARRESIETVIVGGGQAGLALSYYLGQFGREHVVLERGRVAERWRSERWDSLTLLAPNSTHPMPGHAFPGDPDAFASRDEVVRFLDGYASTIRAPLRCGVRVTALRANPGTERLVVETDHAMLEARNVIVATGPFQEPVIPPFAASLPPEVVQVTANRYTNPAQLPPGPVLVVGSATSGCQIVEDLQGAGRHVYLSVGRHRRAVRRYRGRDITAWAYPPLMEVTVDSLPSPEAKRRPGLLWTGVNRATTSTFAGTPARASSCSVTCTATRTGNSSWRPISRRTWRRETRRSWPS